MTTASEIVQQAYREGNLITVGTDPTTAEMTEGLARLNSLIVAYLGVGIGEFLRDWLVPAPQRTAPVAANFPQLPMANDLTSAQWPYPPKNSRIIWNGETQTLYFPEAPNDGSRMGYLQASGFWDGDPDTPQTTFTINGNGRMITNPSTDVTAGSLTFINFETSPTWQWFYRADLATWVPVVALALTDEMVFPTELDDLWALLLAMRLAGRYGKSLSKETLESLRYMKLSAQNRYSQSQDTVYGSQNAPRTPQAYGNPWYGSEML